MTLRNARLHVAGHHLFDVRAEQQHDQHDAADDRNRQQQLLRAFGDELHGNQRPVRGGDKGAAFE